MLLRRVDEKGTKRTYQVGEIVGQLHTPYGLTLWQCLEADD